MKLLELCKTANEKLTELVEVKKAKEVGDNIRNRTKDLVETSDKLIDISGRTAALLSAGILKGTQLTDDSKLIQSLTDMRLKLSEDPSAITSGRTFTTLKKAVEKYAETATERVNEVWKEHVAEIAPKDDNKLLNQHRNTSFSGIVTKLESNFKVAKKLARSAPSDAASLAELNSYWDPIRTDLANLPQADDPEIQAFLVAVGSENGAQLDMLTDSVRAWLLENRMIDDFCVRRRR